MSYAGGGRAESGSPIDLHFRTDLGKTQVDSWVDSNPAVSCLSHELLRINVLDRQLECRETVEMAVANWIDLFPREALYSWDEN